MAFFAAARISTLGNWRCRRSDWRQVAMKSLLAILTVFVFLHLAAAQKESPASTAQQQPAPVAVASQLQSGSLIYAELSKSIDSKKAKVGDPVVAKVTQAVLSHGKIAIPRNTRIIGHLTAAKARTKDQPQAQLGIAFDRAELKDGSQVPLTSATIQALASAFAQNPSAANMANGSAGTADASSVPGSRPGGNMGGMSSPMGGSSYPANNGTGIADSTTGTGTAMPGVRLEPQPQGGLVSVDGKNLKLDSGAQMVLRTQ
jgi:hypothetical protein